jgi:hypothetical protein
MGNHYYTQQLQEDSIINLVADKKENDITMIISDAVFDTNSAITLTEKEQDDLIAGILERRGYIKAVDALHDIAVKIGKNNSNGISANSNEQSRIHPANG